MQSRTLLAKLFKDSLFERTPPSVRSAILDGVATAVELADSGRMPNRTQKKSVLTIKPSRRQTISRKSANAVLDIRRLLKALSSITMLGFTAYHVPLLTGPSVLRMLFEARELVAVELTQTDMCLLLALNELTDANRAWALENDILERARIIADHVGTLDPFVQGKISKACLERLIRLRCVEQDGPRFRLRERINIVLEPGSK